MDHKLVMEGWLSLREKDFVQVYLSGRITLMQERSANVNAHFPRPLRVNDMIKDEGCVSSFFSNV